MADRVRKVHVHAAFARAIPADIGKYALDFAACYGGWSIIVFAGGDSGSGYAHGNDLLTSYGRRRSSREMLAFLQGVAAGRELS